MLFLQNKKEEKLFKPALFLSGKKKYKLTNKINNEAVKNKSAVLEITGNLFMKSQG